MGMTTTPTPAAAGLPPAISKLIDDFAFEAGKSAIGVLQDVDSRTPEGVILKQGFNRAQAALEAALAALPQGAMPGWQWVPVEPTKEMVEAWHRAYDKGQWNAESWESAFSLAHKAMLSSAPLPAAKPSVDLAACEGGGEQAPKDEFLQGVCVALQHIKLSCEVTWGEIVEAVGVDQMLHYATFVEPEEWELAGFNKLATQELKRRRPRINKLAAPTGEGA